MPPWLFARRYAEDDTFSIADMGADDPAPEPARTPSPEPAGPPKKPSGGGERSRGPAQDAPPPQPRIHHAPRPDTSSPPAWTPTPDDQYEPVGGIPDAQVADVPNHDTPGATWGDTGSQLRAAVDANPADETAKLVYADYLEENGDPNRAARIRLGVDARAQAADLMAQWTKAAAAGPDQAFVPATAADKAVSRVLDLARTDPSTAQQFGVDYVRRLLEQFPPTSPDVFVSYRAAWRLLDEASRDAESDFEARHDSATFNEVDRMYWHVSNQAQQELMLGFPGGPGRYEQLVQMQSVLRLATMAYHPRGMSPELLRGRATDLAGVWADQTGAWTAQPDPAAGDARQAAVSMANAIAYATAMGYARAMQAKRTGQYSRPGRQARYAEDDGTFSIADMGEDDPAPPPEKHAEPPRRAPGKPPAGTERSRGGAQDAPPPPQVRIQGASTKPSTAPEPTFQPHDPQQYPDTGTPDEQIADAAPEPPPAPPGTSVGGGAFAAAMDDSSDRTARLVYADWLSENGRPDAGSKLRAITQAAEAAPAVADRIEAEIVARGSRMGDAYHMTRTSSEAQRAIMAAPVWKQQACCVSYATRALDALRPVVPTGEANAIGALLRECERDAVGISDPGERQKLTALVKKIAQTAHDNWYELDPNSPEWVANRVTGELATAALGTVDFGNSATTSSVQEFVGRAVGWAAWDDREAHVPGFIDRQQWNFYAYNFIPLAIAFAQTPVGQYARSGHATRYATNSRYRGF